MTEPATKTPPAEAELNQLAAQAMDLAEAVGAFAAGLIRQQPVAREAWDIARQAAVTAVRVDDLRGSAPGLPGLPVLGELPDWEAVYEPGNVSDYLIGYANDEAPAKAAAEAWLRSQIQEPGRLEWVDEPLLAVGTHDAWWSLIQHSDLGVTATGIAVCHRTQPPL